MGGRVAADPEHVGQDNCVAGAIKSHWGRVAADPGPWGVETVDG